MIEKIVALEGIPHVHNIVKYEKIDEENYLVDGKFHLNKNQVMEVMHFLDNIPCSAYSDYRIVKERLDDEFNDLELFKQMNRIIEDRLDGLKITMLGKDLYNGKIFGTDLPLVLDVEKLRLYREQRYIRKEDNTSSLIYEYLPVIYSDEFFFKEFSAKRYIQYLAKVYFWNHLADKEVWQRCPSTGSITKKPNKTMFYVRNKIGEIIPINSINDTLKQLEVARHPLLERTKGDTILLEANEFALAINKNYQE